MIDLIPERPRYEPVIAPGWTPEKAAAALQEQEERHAQQLAELECYRDDKAYWKRRRTTYGLAKRDLKLRHTREHPDYGQGLGQARLDLRGGYAYGEERPNSHYNLGYRTGWDEGVSMLNSGRPIPTHGDMTREEIVAAREAVRRHDAEREQAAAAAEADRRENWNRLETPALNEHFNRALKKLDARWDPELKVWLVAPERWWEAIKLHRRYYPDDTRYASEAGAPKPAKIATATRAPVPVETPWYNPEFVTAIKTIRGARWDAGSRRWFVPFAQKDAAAVLVARHFAAKPADRQSAPPTFPPEPSLVSIPTPRRSGLSRGQLWQECEWGGCRTEPVCVNCFYCDRHCACEAE